MTGPDTQYLQQRTSDSVRPGDLPHTVHTDRPGDVPPGVLCQTLHTHVVLAEVSQKSVPFTALALKADSVSVRGRVGRVPGNAQVQVGGGGGHRGSCTFRPCGGE